MEIVGFNWLKPPKLMKNAPGPPPDKREKKTDALLTHSRCSPTPYPHLGSHPHRRQAPTASRCRLPPAACSSSTTDPPQPGDGEAMERTWGRGKKQLLPDLVDPLHHQGAILPLVGSMLASRRSPLCCRCQRFPTLFSGFLCWIKMLHWRY